jgi:hypothetical protein
MAIQANSWTFAVVRCECCGYEWEAATEDLPKDSRLIAQIVTEKAEFRCPCPECGNSSCAVICIVGE